MENVNSLYELRVGSVRMFNRDLLLREKMVTR